MFVKSLFALLLCFSAATGIAAGSSEKLVTITYDNPKLKAAGILPYAVSPQGKVYFLLGRQNISTIPSSGLWKGFGGKRDAGETLVQTAVREAKEESRAVLGEECPIYSVVSFPYDETVATEHYNCKYLQLMAPVRWDPSAPPRFQTIVSSSPFEMEKLEIRWVKAEDLYAAIQEAYLASEEQQCKQSEINRIIHVRSEGEYLPLARDFVETLSANYKNKEDSFHLLAQNQMPVPPSLSSDECIFE